MKTTEQIRDESYEVYTCCGNCTKSKWNTDSFYSCYVVDNDPKTVDVCGTCILWEGC